MASICIVTLIGIPAAGKTTFCKILPNYINNYNFIIKHLDELIQDDYRITKENLVFEVKSEIEQLMRLNNFPTPIVFIIDDNMPLKSNRKKYLQIAKEFGLGFIEVYFKVDLQIAFGRNKARANVIPENIILDLSNIMEEPEDGERVMVIDSNWSIDANPVQSDEALLSSISTTQQFNSKELFQLFDEKIKYCLDNPVKTIEIVEKVPLPLSKLQEVDLVLRNIVSKFMKNCENKSKGRILSENKKKIFQLVKDGEISIDISWDRLELDKFLEQVFLEFN